MSYHVELIIVIELNFFFRVFFLYPLFLFFYFFYFHFLFALHIPS